MRMLLALAVLQGAVDFGGGDDSPFDENFAQFLLLLCHGEFSLEPQAGYPGRDYQ